MTWGKTLMAGCVSVALLAACSSSVRPRSTPAAPRPTSTTTAEPTTSTTISGSTSVTPEGVAFWTAQEGLIVATLATPACLRGAAVCPGGLIERTTDGGQTWKVVDQVDTPLDAVTTAGNGVAWVTAGRCGPASPDACGSEGLLETADGGTTWKRVVPTIGVTSVAPISATTAWAVAGAGGAAFPTGSTTLVHTADGGRTWQTKSNPCASTSGLGLWAVGFDGAAAGWATCTSQPATDMQPKALLRTLNGGASWSLQAETCALAGQGSDVGAMSCVGYLPGAQLLADGHGWIWLGRYGLTSTTDGGRTWAQIASGIVNDDINSVLSASLVTNSTGFILITSSEAHPPCPALGCGPELLATTNSGQSWTTLAHWNAPSTAG